MSLKILALGLTALATMPAGAHLFALPNKITMSEVAYFTAQSVYAGWSIFSIAILSAIAANGMLFVVLRRTDPAAAAAALASAILICLSLAVFFIWVFPANLATDNWTSAPANWETLRRNWEYGHAASALLTFAALLATGRAMMK